MALIHQVKTACARLAPGGWDEVFARFGLDIKAGNLGQELARALPKLAGTTRPSVPGFEDFSRRGVRGVEPGVPDRSLLYHGFASPNVIRTPDGTLLTRFPTPAELEALEHYIYGLEPPGTTTASLRQCIRRRTGLSPAVASTLKFAVAVFAYEYRPASESINRKEAGLCFSRTGVCRVGTAPPQYSPVDRGFHPTPPGQPHDFAVLPARYGAFLAFRARPSAAEFGPMGNPETPDARRRFWVPFHKLFPGDECVQGLSLHLTLRAQHVNEKLRRVHGRLGMGQTNLVTPDLADKPFVLRDQAIASFSSDRAFGTGLLVPAASKRLVEPARVGERLLAFRVPPNRQNLSSSFTFEMPGDPRDAPEYVHARHRLEADGTITDLNDPAVVPDVEKAVAAGGYFAVHYVDFTGDGWITAVCPELAHLPSLAAYSLVTAPDFHFNTSQRALLDWVVDESLQIPPPIPPSLRNTIWGDDPPWTLSDERKAVNVTLNGYGAPFDPADLTMTAIVGLALDDRPDTTAPLVESNRHACLPDAASGTFAPGWDVSLALTGEREHLAAFGLGSPFPEDAKLCAALSAFWPAVAPDAARAFNPNGSDPNVEEWPTVCPLTDEEIGIVGSLPWDGYSGPRLRPDGRVEYVAFAYADYVRSALDRKFTAALTSRMTVDDYRHRVLAMARVYRALRIRGQGIAKKKAAWAVLSFREAESTDQERQEAEQAMGASLQDVVYRFQMYKHGRPQERQGNRMLVKVRRGSMAILFVDDRQIVMKKVTDGTWRHLVQ